MTFLRSLAYQGFLILSVLLAGSAIILADRFVSYRRISLIARHWGYWNLAALRILCNLHLRVVGKEYLEGRPAILMCNHQSSWETIALRAMLPLEHAWVVKAELIRVPVLGSVLRRLGAIAVDRSTGRRAIKQLLLEGKQWLAQGRWVVIFPEGTRVAHGEKKPYNIGGALLAERAGSPVIPIAHNSGLFWGRRSFVKYPGTIDLVIGAPIDTQGKGAIEINGAVEKWIDATLAGLPQKRDPTNDSQTERKPIRC